MTAKVSAANAKFLRILKQSDPREMPAYGIAEAAHYLQLPVATLKSWVLGRPYPTKSGPRQFQPLIALPERGSSFLSFINLVEVHVLSAFRRDHRIEMSKIRTALNYVKRHFGWEHPLVEQEFETDGVALFVDRLSHFIDVSAGGQLVMKTVRAHFKRLERVDNIVTRLYPFTRVSIEDSPMSVMIDPRFAFGRPCLVKSHIPTAVIAERYKAGDSIDELAEDYGCTRLEIEEALRCELDVQSAA
jgi:uncharacterized protein (DUF433 family)